MCWYRKMDGTELSELLVATKHAVQASMDIDSTDSLLTAPYALVEGTDETKKAADTIKLAVAAKVAVPEKASVIEKVAMVFVESGMKKAATVTRTDMKEKDQSATALGTKICLYFYLDLCKTIVVVVLQMRPCIGQIQSPTEDK